MSSILTGNNPMINQSDSTAPPPMAGGVVVVGSVVGRSVIAGMAVVTSDTRDHLREIAFVFVFVVVLVSIFVLVVTGSMAMSDAIGTGNSGPKHVFIGPIYYYVVIREKEKVSKHSAAIYDEGLGERMGEKKSERMSKRIGELIGERRSERVHK